MLNLTLCSLYESRVRANTGLPLARAMAVATKTAYYSIIPISTNCFPATIQFFSLNLTQIGVTAVTTTTVQNIAAPNQASQIAIVYPLNPF